MTQTHDFDTKMITGCIVGGIIVGIIGCVAYTRYQEYAKKKEQQKALTGKTA